LEHIKEAYEQSHKVYGYCNITKDLREAGIIANKKRIARLMALHKLYVQCIKPIPIISNNVLVHINPINHG